MAPNGETSREQAGRIAGVDYGTVRIGIAIADLSVRIASPHENYTRRTPELDAEFFRRLADEEAIDKSAARFREVARKHLS